MNTTSKLSSKLANVKKSIGNNMTKSSNNKPQGSAGIINTLTDYSNSFRRAISGNNILPGSNTRAKNQANNTTGSDAQPVYNPYIIAVVVVIALAFLAYGTYSYLAGASTVQSGKTFYGEDLLNYDPLFKINTDKIEPCLDRCSKDSLCAGITFDSDTLTCVASRRGKLRDDTNNYASWVKPPAELIAKAKTITLLGFASGNTSVKSVDIPMPYSTDSMTLAFVLYVDDFYQNQGAWQHVLHKGTQLEEALKTPNWEDVVKMCPDQYCGVWLAPFNNNLRICITTVTDRTATTRPTYPHANTQAVDPVTGQIYITDKPSNPLADPRLVTAKALSGGQYTTAEAGLNLVKTIEYIDIANIPTKKPVHVAINLDGGTLEVYLNGKLHQILGLHGHAEYNNGDLYVKHPNTFSGNVLDVTYTPKSLDKTAIMALAGETDILAGKYANEIKNVKN